MNNQTLSTNNKIDNKKKYFIVFICMFLQAVPYSIAQNIQPLFVPQVPYLINSWFPKEGRGKALGIAFSGGSIGNVFLQQITSQMLASRGVTYSYIFFGVLALVCSLPIVMIFVRLPKAGEVEVVEENESEEVQTSGFDGLGAKATKQNKYFWLFSIGYAIIAVSISALSTQYATYFTGELGLSATLVGTLGSVFALGYVFGSTLVGMIVDKVGFGAAWIVMLGCVVVGYTLLLGSIKKVKEQYAEMEVEI